MERGTSTLSPPPTTNNDHIHRLAFLWENASQYNTRTLRDTVSFYSHLPFGILLDDKWALARSLGSSSRNGGGGGDDDNDDAFNNPHLATLESHCFRGAEFVKFAKRVGLLLPSTTNTPQLLRNKSGTTSRENQAELGFTTAASSVTITAACNIPSSSAPCAINVGVDNVGHHVPRYQFYDLLLPPSSGSMPPPPSPRNLRYGLSRMQ